MKYLALAVLLLTLPLLNQKGAAEPANTTSDGIYALYARGDYAAAIKAGEAAHDAHGYAMAARAALADAALRPSPCMECLQQGERLARAAVAADPQLADGQIWLAVALGYQTRIKGIVWSRLHDLPAQSKAALDAAVADDPANPYAVSALGGWHVEIVKAAGPFMARHIFDASLPEAISLFDRAVKVAPGNVAVRYQIALSLAGLDRDAWRSRIASELDAAMRDTAATAYEKAMQERAAELKALLTGNRASFDEKVRKFQGYP
jgi:tetratricopeptide (TPR) repeat protein